MRFGILGPLEIILDGRPVRVGAAKERALIVRLLLDRGRTVAIDRLVEDLWEGEPPESANVSVRVHVSRVRKTLEAAGAPKIILTEHPGYRIDIADDALDTVRFEQLLERARAQLAADETGAASETLAEAVALWRGPALADVAGYDFARAETARLEEARLAAIEEKMNADLVLGRHGALVGELEALTHEHPLRERLWGQRMVALYRAGRQAEALAVYQQLRSTLVEELGIDPSPEIARLEQQILAQAPELGVAPSVHTASAAPQLPSGVVTFLLTDIEDSTRSWDTNPDAMAEALERHDRLISDVVTAHGGHFLQAKGEGDSTMSVFRRASDGAAAAFALLHQLQAESWPGDLPIRVRIAVNTGEAHERGGDYFGPAVNRTARIRSLASGGVALVSQATAELIHDRLPKEAALVDLGRHELKGFARTEQVFELRPAGDARVNQAPAQAASSVELLIPRLPLTLAAYAGGVFVGREAELERLKSVWKETAAGERRAVFLAGEPGIGKTRLAAEFAAWAHREGGQVLYGRLDEETVVPYRPFIEALRENFAMLSDEALRTMAPPSASELTRLVPELAQRLPELPAPIAGDPDGERYRLFEAMVDLGAAPMKRPPVLMVLDDLHWADKPTLLMLKHMLRAQASRSVMYLGTYRETELSRSHPLAEILADLRRENAFERVLLKGLPEPEVGTLIGSLTKTAAPEPLTRAVFQETDGNPFFVGEVVRHLTDAGIPPGASEDEVEAIVRRVGIPEGIREVIGRRLSRLSDECNEILQTASVLGREINLDVLTVASDVGIEKVLPLIEEAAAARVVAEVPGRVGRYAFVHALIREALYQELSAARRAHIHRRVGEALEAIYGANLEPHLAELAHHFLQAVGIGDSRKAVDYSVRAGSRASRMLAHEEAVEHYRRAVHTLEFESRDDELYCDALTALATAQRKSGDVARALETVIRAADVARGLGSAERLARAALSYSERLEYVTPMAEVRLSQIRALLEDAAASLPEEDSVLRIRVYARLATFSWWTAPERGEELSRRALEMAERVGDLPALAYAMAARQVSLWSPDVNERLASAEDLLHLALEIGDKEREFEARHWRAFALLELGRAAEAERHVDEYAQAAAEMRQPMYLRQVATFRAAQASFEGRFDDAERFARDAMEMGEREGDPDASMLFLSQMVHVWRFRGQLAGMDPQIARTVEGYPFSFLTVDAGLSMIAVETGRLSLALELFESAVSDLESIRQDVAWLQTMAFIAETCFALRDQERAATLHRLLEPFADRIVVIGPPILGCMWPVSYYLGLLDETLSSLDLAISHHEDALSRTRAMGGTPLAACVEHALSRALLARNGPGDHERAQGLLSSALATAEQLGMPPLAAKVRALLRPPLPAALRGAPATPFVGREAELEQLVALSNSAGEGAPRAAFIAGEPGIGKTRLAAEFAASAHREGAVVLYGRSDEETLVPYQPFVEALRAFMSSSPDELLRSVLGPSAGELVRLVPDLTRRVPDLPPPIQGDPEGERYRLFEAVGDLFSSIALNAAVVLVLDDLHWADKPTLLLLKHLLRRDEPGRVLIVGTYRETELARTHPLSETLADLRRDQRFERVILRGLSEPEVGALIGNSAVSEDPTELARAVYRETEGNPFFVGEIIRHLEDVGPAVDFDRVGIPEGIKEVIGRRIAHLSGDANDALAAASVVGREFGLDLLIRVTDLPPNRLIVALEEATNAGIVEEIPAEADRFAFSHALIRDTLYEELSASRRIRVHEQIAETLEQLFADDLEPHLAEIAHHYVEAARRGTTDKAVAYAARAGYRAMTLLAYEEATEQYRRSLQTLELDPHVDEQQRRGLLLAMAGAHVRSGEMGRARAILDDVAASARSGGAVEDLARAALLYTGLELISGPLQEEHRRVQGLLEEAASALPSTDTSLRARVLSRLASVIWFTDFSRVDELSRQALDVAKRTGDPEALGSALGTRLYSTWVDDPVERLAIIDEMLHVALDSGSRELELDARQWRILHYAEKGPIDMLEREMTTYADLASQLKQPIRVAVAVGFRSARAQLEGRFVEGEELAREALRIRERIEPTQAGAYLLGQTFLTWVLQGTLAARAAEIQDILGGYARTTNSAGVAAGIATLLLELGRTDEAREMFVGLASEGFRTIPRDVIWANCMTLFSEICQRLDEPTHAPILYELILPFEDRVVVVGPPLMSFDAPFSYFLGLLAETMRKPELAERHYERALEMASGMNARPHVARIKAAHGRTLLARGAPGDVDQAHELLSSALAIAEELGMKPLADEARSLLRPPLPPTLTSLEGGLFVGRVDELGRLASLWSEAVGGAARTVLISGEPGIGKTRLAAEFARRAYSEGAVVLYGRSDEDAVIPNQPFVEALSGYIARCDLGELREHVGRYGGDLSAMIPELARRVPDLPQPVSAEAEFERYRVFEAVAGLLSEASRRTPIVLILDDLHWATKPTLLLLRHILRSDAPMRLLVVGTYRETDLDRTHPLAEALADLRRERTAERIALAGFDEDGVVQYLSAAAGHDFEDPMAVRSFARALHAETEGNPFFIREVLNHLAESGIAYQKEGRWTSDQPLEEVGLPQGVREAVTRRLSRLSPAANKVLSVASIVGTAFSVDVLERIPEAGGDGLLDALDEARNSGLIIEVEKPGEYRFAHSLVRQTLAAEVSSIRRIRLHNAIAEAMEKVYARDPEPHLDELARHFFEASTVGDPAKAIDYARRAGEQAMTRVAYEEAAAHYQRALQTIDLDAGDDALRCALLLSLGDALGSAAEPAARDVLFEAAAIARARGSKEDFARAALLLARTWDFTAAMWTDTEVRALLEEASAILSSEQTALLARVLARLSQANMAVPDVSAAQADRAIEIARAIGDPLTLVFVTSVRGDAFRFDSHGAQRVLADDEVLRLVTQTGDRESQLKAHQLRVFHSMVVGDAETLEREFDELARLAEDLRQPAALRNAATIRATRAYMRGNFDEGERLAREALAVGERFDPVGSQLYFATQRFLPLRMLGRYDEAAQAIASFEPFPIAAFFITPSALIHAEQGAIDQARSMLEQAMAEVATLGDLGVAVRCLLAETCHVLWDQHHAAELYEQLLPRAGANVVTPPGLAFWWPVSYYLGLLAETMGMLDAAVEHFEDALAMTRRMDTPPLTAYVECAYGRVLVVRGRPGDRERARALISSALATAERLGMPPLVEKARALLGTHEA